MENAVFGLVAQWNEGMGTIRYFWRAREGAYVSIMSLHSYLFLPSLVAIAELKQNGKER